MNNGSSPIYSLKQLLISDAELLPVYVNPQAKSAEAEVAMWATSNDITLPHMELILSMTAFLYPQADLAQLVIIGKLMFLLFYIDDVYGDLASSQGLQTVNADVLTLIEDCCNTFTDAHRFNSSDKLVNAFLQVRHEMENYAPEAWMKRFGESLANHLLCSVKPALFGWNVCSQSVETYIRVREQISGMYPTIDFIEFANGCFLPRSAMRQPIIHRLRLRCAQIASLTNDLFSYQKEVEEQGLHLNLIQVLRTVSGCTFGEAAQQAIKLINQTSLEFFNDIKIAGDYDWDHENKGMDAEIAVDAYLTGLHYQISASWHWQMNTNRYRSPSSPFGDLRVPLQPVHA